MSNEVKIPLGVISVAVGLLIAFGAVQAQVKGNDGDISDIKDSIKNNQKTIIANQKALSDHTILAQKTFNEYSMKQEAHNGEIKSMLTGLTKDIEYLRGNSG